VPAAIRHLGVDYAVDHLVPHREVFRWIDNGQVLQFSVHIRYSPHCYSQGLEGDAPAESYVFSDPGGRRMFAPHRHAHSLLVPGMIRGLVAKPTSRVSLTFENNWSIYALSMTPPLQTGELFYVFFRIRRSDPSELANGDKAVELYVESAYARSRLVSLREHKPFGAAVLAAHKK
jgi:hypothetical protein